MSSLPRMSAGDGTPGLLPALLAIVAAVLLWVAGDDQRSQLPELQQRLRLATSIASRGSNEEVTALKTAAQDARSERAAIEFQLQANEPEALVRARLVFSLRQQCTAAGAAVCSVRLADDSSALKPVASAGSSAPGRDARELTLQSIGISRARAIVSGTFINDEVLKLVDALASDPTARWRVNAVVVRSNSFELDVERHLLPPRPAAVSKP